MNTNIFTLFIRRALIAAVFASLAVSCIKEPDYVDPDSVGSIILFRDSLYSAADASAPLVIGIDADDDGINECSLALYWRDSIAYTVIRPNGGCAVSVDKLAGSMAPYLFAQNHGLGDTIRKTDQFSTDSVFLAYRHVADTILGELQYCPQLGNKYMIVFRRTSYYDTRYWWLELQMVGYSQLRLIRNSLPTEVKLR